MEEIRITVPTGGMQIESAVYRGQQIETTLYPKDFLSGATVATIQAEFPLTDGDYLRLKNGKPVTLALANGVCFAVIGFAFGLLPKLLSNFSDKPEALSKYEWIALAIGIVITILLYVIGLFLPNERKTMARKIEEHFKNSPRARAFVSGQK
jgi:membrane associated rhomboid family serine protease